MTLNERKKYLMRMAVLYLIANREDAIVAFDNREWQDDENVVEISVNGDTGKPPTEDELDLLMRTLQ